MTLWWLWFFSFIPWKFLFTCSIVIFLKQKKIQTLSQLLLSTELGHVTFKKYYIHLIQTLQISSFIIHVILKDISTVQNFKTYTNVQCILHICILNLHIPITYLQPLPTVHNIFTTPSILFVFVFCLSDTLPYFAIPRHCVVPIILTHKPGLVASLPKTTLYPSGTASSGVNSLAPLASAL